MKELFNYFVLFAAVLCMVSTMPVTAGADRGETYLPGLEELAEGSTIYTQYTRPEQHPDRFYGILYLEHPDNPFTYYSMIGIPVCTGDVHANLLAQHFPDAHVAGLGDDAGSYGSDIAAGRDAGRWGIPDVLRAYPGWENISEGLGVEGTIELLLSPDKWNPEDRGGPCPQDADKFSLWCAVPEVARNVSGKSPGMHAVTWEIIYETAAYTGERSSRSIITFSNDPDVTHEQVIALLNEVRERIGVALVSEKSGFFDN